MVPRALPLTAVMLLALSGACGERAAPPLEAPAPPDVEVPPPLEPPEAPKAEESATLQGFRASMEAFVEACGGADPARARRAARALLLPNARAWFEATFPADKIPDLLADYSRHQETIDDLPGVIRHHLEEGKTHIAVERFESPGDELATGFQSYALQMMTTPTALYSLRLADAGAESGWHLWSFVHADGRFRFVGPLWTLTPLVVDEEVRLRSSMRLRDARKLREDR